MCSETSLARFSGFADKRSLTLLERYMEPERQFETGSVSINYAHFEETPARGHDSKGAVSYPLVLLHGGSARWQAGQAIIPGLSRYGPVYALDFRGHGKSGRVTGHYTLRDYALDVIAFLERVVQSPAVVFGHSMGGQVALMVAAERPDLVLALIAGEAPCNKDKLRPLILASQERLVFWRDLAGGGLPRDEVAAALRDTPIEVAGQAEPVPAHTVFGENSPWYGYMAENLYHLDPSQLEAVLEFEEMHEGLDARVLLPRITCPVLLLQGNPALGGMPDEDVNEILSLLADGRAAHIETVGHPLHVVDPEPVLVAIESFLAELPMLTLGNAGVRG
jgi:pimeloyl-ACP methyl ester carboxylesterase